jgi:hypothetical protein
MSLGVILPVSKSDHVSCESMYGYVAKDEEELSLRSVMTRLGSSSEDRPLLVAA